jgi:hypothetical protein
MYRQTRASSIYLIFPNNSPRAVATRVLHATVHLPAAYARAARAFQVWLSTAGRHACVHRASWVAYYASVIDLRACAVSTKPLLSVSRHADFSLLLAMLTTLIGICEPYRLILPAIGLQFF